MSLCYHQTFSVFNALSDGVRVMKNEFQFFGVLVVLYALLASLPYILFYQNVDLSDPAEVLEFIQNGDVPFVAIYAFYYILYAIFIIITLDKTHASFHDISFSEYPYISRAIKAVIPVIGLYILSMILTVLGLLLLIIPGIIVMLTLYLSIPAKLAENIGILAALDRSKDLTKGNRWAILGTVLVPVIPMVVVSLLLMTILLGDLQATGDVSPLFQFLNALVSSLFAVYFVVVMGVIYQQIVAERKFMADESY
ncbi:hypothetical protein [Pseudemcibacter aquimaris]|uniref:hypothetical protein n=1 Tax=Pseudemcibacter aquimaris TaxID=2857064 RepID=UPI0020137EF7|nr:hypothetical protein [Pseudemcibacter aquimaris]MCC3860127.1 hypothetical protein [Pseudemcibacter aquimaris]WDU57454.1 hypothetical protein KW060_09620 [Pseudemcibacter aquimaris]